MRGDFADAILAFSLPLFSTTCFILNLSNTRAIREWGMRLRTGGQEGGQRRGRQKLKRLGVTKKLVTPNASKCEWLWRWRRKERRRDTKKMLVLFW